MGTIACLSYSKGFLLINPLSMKPNTFVKANMQKQTLVDNYNGSRRVSLFRSHFTSKTQRIDFPCASHV